MKFCSWALQALATSSSLLITAASASSLPPRTNLNENNAVVFESIHQVPRGWTRVRSGGAGEVVKLRLSLRQQNLDAFYSGLMEVSTPGHPRYGQHYAGHELRSLLQPSAEATEIATRWLRDGGVRAIRDDGDYLFFRTTVATASRLLDAQFDWYQNGDGEQLLRTTSYSVPPAVARHINFVQPTTRFGSTKPLASHVDIMGPGQVSDGQSKWVSAAAAAPDGIKTEAAAAGVNASCSTSITPQCLFQLYNINLKGSSAGNNSVGYASFVGETARFSDMAAFSKVYAPFAAATNVRSVANFPEHEAHCPHPALR